MLILPATDIAARLLARQRQRQDDDPLIKLNFYNRIPFFFNGLDF